MFKKEVGYNPSGLLAQKIMFQKYSMDGKESWAEIAYRVATNVMGAVGADKETVRAVYELIRDRKFLPAGRYLYASGRPYHQTQNCLLLRAEDTREGWAELLHKSGMALMTGAGIGVDYSALREKGAPIKKTGGTASGPTALMQMINETGRHVMQGGSRRSAIWAGLNWNHPDIMEFISLKNWSDDIRKLKEKDFNFPATMDMTNISVIFDKEFFTAFKRQSHSQHSLANNVYWAAVRQMLSTSEPGLSINYDNPRESLRNAPVVGETRVLTNGGYKSIKELVDRPVTVWTGKQWADNVTFKLTNPEAELVTVSLTNGRSITCDPLHPFIVLRYIGSGAKKKEEVHRVNAIDLNEDDKIVSDLPQLDSTVSGNGRDYGMGFVYGDGSIRLGRGEISVHCEEKQDAYLRAKDGLDAKEVTVSGRAYFKAEVTDKSQLLSTTLSPDFIAGWFDADGCYTRKLLRISNKSPIALTYLQESLDLLGIKSVIRQDGESSYKSGNVMYTLDILSDSLVRFKQVIPTTRIQLNDITTEYKPYRASHIRVASVEVLERRAPVYCCDVGVAEHSFMAEGVIISNCTEAVSEDDSDICNLGSINLAQIGSLEEFRTAVELGTLFLLAGTVYSDLPYPKVNEVREKNRRLGLGLMGIHEWLLLRGGKYSVSQELTRWLKEYEKSTEIAHRYSDQFNLSKSVKTRAIAPTGTIGIVAETTTGIEPIFCVSYKRRYLKHTTWHYQYVIDSTAEKLIQNGIKPDQIEDAYSIPPETRIRFQCEVQQYVDQSISSTCNIPAWGSEQNNESKVQEFGDMLFDYLPGLRGLTCYADGSRGGQPLVPVRYQTAIQHRGEELVESYGDVCDITKGGSCGS